VFNSNQHFMLIFQKKTLVIYRFFLNFEDLEILWKIILEETAGIRKNNLEHNILVSQTIYCRIS
jgi:hypothetical protein